MPNWCENKLIIIGNEREIEKFRKEAKHEDHDLCLNNLTPMPRELINTKYPPEKKNNDLLAKYGVDNWHDWCIKNWGTKWNVEARLVYEGKKCLRYEFDSAWTPPLNWVGAVSKEYPGLLFILEYDESGVEFRGIAKFQAGKQLVDVFIDYYQTFLTRIKNCFLEILEHAKTKFAVWFAK